MTWAEDLPRIRAENEAWREKHLPKLRAAQAEKERNRDRCATLLSQGLAAISASDEDRRIVERLTGFTLPSRDTNND